MKSPLSSSQQSSAGARLSSPSIRMHWVESVEAFATLRPAWNVLVARTGQPSVFLRHEWFDAAWQWAGASSELRVLCVAEGEDLVGILPLTLRRVRWGARTVWELSLLTVPDTQFCDAIVAEDRRAEAVSALADALHAARAQWDVLRFAYLPADSLIGGALRLALAQKGLRSVSAEAVGNPFVSLDRSWETYYATRTRSLKKANNLAANRLKKAGEVKIERLTPGAGSSEDQARLLETFIDISARSWKTRTGNSLDNPGPQAFIRRLSELAHEQGWLSLWLLYLDGVPLAMEYQLAADGDVFALRSDFDGARDDLSPGSHLSRVLLETLFTECKGRYYMGPGENAYKYRWTEELAPISQLAVYSSSLTGRLLAAWEISLKPLARRVRDRLKPAAPAVEPAAAEG